MPNDLRPRDDSRKPLDGPDAHDAPLDAPDAHDAPDVPLDAPDALDAPLDAPDALDALDALDREIAGDRAEAIEARRRLWLFLPPLVSLGLAITAVGMSHPRSVVGARLIAGPVPPAATAWHARLVAVRTTPGGDGDVEPLANVPLRLTGASVRGEAEPTDADGVAEITLLPPLADKLVVEAQVDGAWRSILTVPIHDLPQLKDVHPPTPTRPAIVRDAASQELAVDVAAELGVLAPPLEGAAWIRVSRVADDSPVAGAAITVEGEAGVEGDIAPATTNASGLARVVIHPIAPPVLLEVKASITKDGTLSRGHWRGVLRGVLGVPLPLGNGRYESGVATLTLRASSSRPRAYVDLWKDGVRMGGRALSFDALGLARVPLPQGVNGVWELEIGGSPEPPSVEDLGHSASIPIVFGTDAVDAWGAVAASTRFASAVVPSGGLDAYGPAVAASIARAPVMVPPRAPIADSLKQAINVEHNRITRVRRVSTFAVLGGGALEVGLLALLGVLSRGRDAQAEIDALLGDEAAPRVLKRTPIVAVAFAALGAIVLVFSALALMAYGLG